MLWKHLFRMYQVLKWLVIVKAVGEKVTSVKPGSSVVTLLGTKNATGYAEYTLS